MPIYAVKNVKKDGQQKYRVVYNYTDHNGEYKTIERTAYGKANAKLKEEELRIMTTKGSSTGSMMTLDELFNEYIKAKSYEVRESSLDKTRRILKGRVLDTLGNKKIDKLFPSVLQEWKANIEEIDSIKSVSTKRGIFKEFHAMMNYAVKMDYIIVNPLDKVGNFKDAYAYKKEMLFYTPEEFRKFISAARQCRDERAAKGDYTVQYYYMFFMIAFFTGMRKGEINALTWEDVSNGMINVRRSVNQKLKGGDRITPPKNASSVRDIQIPNELKTALDHHKEICSKLPGFSEKMYICGGDMPIRDTSIAIMNNRFADMAGVKRIRIHDFRHSHASLLANNGISIHEIARRLGHADIKMTLQIYSHLYPSETERALRVLNEIKL